MNYGFDLTEDFAGWRRLIILIAFNHGAMAQRNCKSELMRLLGLHFLVVMRD